MNKNAQKTEIMESHTPVSEKNKKEKKKEIKIIPTT